MYVLFGSIGRRSFDQAGRWWPGDRVTHFRSSFRRDCRWLRKQPDVILVAVDEGGRTPGGVLHDGCSPCQGLLLRAQPELHRPDQAIAPKQTKRASPPSTFGAPILAPPLPRSARAWSGSLDRLPRTAL